MTKDEALKLALEALEGVVKNCWRDIPSWRLDEIKERITTIKQALAAQPAVQEPVGYVAENGVVDWNVCAPPILTDLYTTPPAAQPASEADMQVYRSISDNYRKDLAAAHPAVPDAIHHTDLSEHPQYIQGWNDCRAEMLKGMKP
jgi:hypothetical protein